MSKPRQTNLVPCIVLTQLLLKVISSKESSIRELGLLGFCFGCLIALTARWLPELASPGGADQPRHPSTSAIFRHLLQVSDSLRNLSCLIIFLQCRNCAGPLIQKLDAQLRGKSLHKFQLRQRLFSLFQLFGVCKAPLRGYSISLGNPPFWVDQGDVACHSTSKSLDIVVGLRLSTQVTSNLP